LKQTQKKNLKPDKITPR